VLVEERNFAEFAGEFARDYFGKCHEASLRVGRHGEAALERSGTVSSAALGTKDEGVAVVEGDGWLDVDGSRQVRHEIFGESPYLVRQLSMNVASPRSVTRRKRHVAHNLDRFGPRSE
jgi:hypothetical protein